MTTILMVVFLMVAVLAMVKALIYRDQRNTTRALLADYISACDDWQIAYNELVSTLSAAQMHAYDIQHASGNGHKHELPLIVGKSGTAMIMVDDSPMVKITEFKNRKGETVKIESPVKTEKSDKETKAESALPQNESTSDVLGEVVKECGKLSDKETDKITAWESGKGKGTVSEYVKRIENMRKGK